MLSLRTLVAGLAAVAAMAVAPAAANATATGSNHQDIGYKKHLQSNATQYTNGFMVLDSYARNENWFYAMRPRTLVVTVDGAGRAIWVSRVFNSATVCGVFDPTCASQRRETFTDSAPPAIGEYAHHLDVYHADNPNYTNLRNQLIDMIKAGTDVAQAVRDAWNQLQKS